MVATGSMERSPSQQRDSQKDIPVYEMPGTTSIPAIFYSPLVWGGIFTLGFYSAIPRIPWKQSFLQRYFCSHPLEYATTVLFCIAMANLLGKFLLLLKEKAVWHSQNLFHLSKARAYSAEETAFRLRALLEKMSFTEKRTLLVARLRDAVSFVRVSKSSKGLEEHLRYLADLASDRLHSGYAFLRTITWAIPILGFLGTVIGITIAIANVTPEQLDGSLADVTSGLAVAFDTTALALGLSLILVFCTFVVERSEQTNLAQIEEWGIKYLLGLFPQEQEQRFPSPFAKAEEQASRELMAKTEKMIEWQMQLWQEGIESLRSRWEETLTTQQQLLHDSLNTSVQDTVQHQHQQWNQSQQQFLHLVQQLLSDLTTRLEMRDQSQQDFFGNVQSNLELLGHQFHADVSGIQDQLQEQTRTLLGILQQEEQLQHLHSQLTLNTQSLLATESFHEAVQNLNQTLAQLSHSPIEAISQFNPV